MITRKTVATSLFWSGVGTATNFALSLAIKLVLAYYLFPEHFGLIGMAAAATALAKVFADMGIASALIQKKKEEIKPLHWSSAFWANIVVNWLGFALVVFVVSPLAILSFDEQQVGSLIIGMSFSLLLNPLSIINRVQLTKNMKFKQIFFANLIGNICGGTTGILLAMNNFGVWSFVGQSVVSGFVSMPIFRLLSPWTLTYQFSFGAIRNLMSFGVYDVGTRLVGYAYNSLNILILGVLLDPVTVGLFAFARSLTLSLMDPINSFTKKVFFPFFSEIQENRERIKRYHLTQISYVTAFIFPFSAGMSLLAYDVFFLVWGDKWLGAVFPLQILAAFIAVLAAGGTPAVILKSVGQISLAYRLQITRFLIIKVPLVLIGGLLYGFRGFLVALLLSQVIVLAVDFYVIRNTIELRIKELLSQIISPFLATCVMILFLIIIETSGLGSSVISIVIRVVLGAVAYTTTFLSLNQLLFGSLLPTVGRTSGRPIPGKKVAY